MLLYPAIRDLLDKVPSRYQLVNLVAARARRLSNEAELEGKPLTEKAVSLAIKEVEAGTLKVEEEPEETQAPAKDDFFDEPEAPEE